MAQSNPPVRVPPDVAAFLETLAPGRRKDEAGHLLALFDSVTGWTPAMWGPSIIGYGRYDYRYASGHSGTSLATGFSPRKAAHSIYIMPGYGDFAEILSRLGKHRIGKSCLYLTSLEGIDMDVLAELIRAGLDDLARHWPVEPG